MSNTSPRRLVTLIRHAKAEEDKGMLPDDLRVLNARGLADAAALAEWLTMHAFAPDRILCSTAQRTQQTLAALHLDALVEFSEALYLATAPALLGMIQALPNNVRHVAIIGHNPGLHVLAAQLVASYAHAADEEKLMQKFPTSCCAMLSLPDKPWRETSPGSATLERLR